MLKQYKKPNRISALAFMGMKMQGLPYNARAQSIQRELEKAKEAGPWPKSPKPRWLVAQADSKLHWKE